MARTVTETCAGVKPVKKVGSVARGKLTGTPVKTAAAAKRVDPLQELLDNPRALTAFEYNNFTKLFINAEAGDDDEFFKADFGQAFDRSILELKSGEDSLFGDFYV